MTPEDDVQQAPWRLFLYLLICYAFNQYHTCTYTPAGLLIVQQTVWKRFSPHWHGVLPGAGDPCHS
ncbi:hypothetical protein Q4595_26585, partial [Wenyingzhuangia sp. 1_MG-2023]|nr:hypothetical protein [Wenyingzhuangia sp. 1_MG-2023]